MILQLTSHDPFAVQETFASAPWSLPLMAGQAGVRVRVDSVERPPEGGGKWEAMYAHEASTFVCSGNSASSALLPGLGQAGFS